MPVVIFPATIAERNKKKKNKRANSLKKYKTSKTNKEIYALA